jgi:hypothetical protein
VFENLYFLSDTAFRNFNFSDFWADSATETPFEPVSEQYIEARIRDAYAPDGEPPEIYFYSILPFTLSELCCKAFLRSNPGLPISERDYYLSKLFQFLYRPLVESVHLEWIEAGEIAAGLRDFLDQLPELVISKLARFDWEGFYQDTWLYEPRDVLPRLPQHLPSDISQDVSQTPRKRGFDPDMENHLKVASIVAECESDWKGNLPQICVKLDDLEVPYPEQWAGWRRALETGKQDLVIKAIQYRLRMVKMKSRAPTPRVFP